MILEDGWTLIDSTELMSEYQYVKKYITTTSEVFDLLDSYTFENTMVFIEDINKIWYNGVYYGGNSIFIPHMSEDGTLSWTNHEGLENPEPINIKGPQGEKGEKGDRGSTGAQGLKGDKGEQGIQGIQGEKGDTITGARIEGDITTDEDGFTITPIVFVGGSDNHDLNEEPVLVYTAQGIQGIQGIQGEKGEQGIQGIQGIQGEKGDKGDKGDKGLNGAFAINYTDGLLETTSDLTMGYYNIGVVEIEGSDILLSMNSNTYYRCIDTVNSLTINLNTPEYSNIVNNYIIEFSTGENGCTLGVPENIKWSNGTTPDIEFNTTYQLSIINNLSVISKFS
jgi:hypothetical protein